MEISVGTGGDVCNFCPRAVQVSNRADDQHDDRLVYSPYNAAAAAETPFVAGQSYYV